MPVDPDELEQAVSVWVRCEWAYRLGPNAYQTPEQDELIKAEERLRRALTGKGSLGAAFERLGGKVMPRRPALHENGKDARRDG